MGLEIRENSVEEKILEVASEQFLKYGIRSVTMTDIAKELGISKRTIYQSFKDKDEIVSLVCEQMCQKDRDIVEEIEENTEDAIDAVLKLSDYFKEIFANLNPAMLYDMKKYYQDAWLIFKNFKNTFAFESIKKNIERGIKSGLYREGINVGLIATMRIAQIDLILDDEVFPKEKYSLLELQSEMTEHFLRGIVTLEGFKRLEQYKTNI